jgi:ABC-type transport system involved in multi-copper enzyme maturation permease subunit
VSNGRAEGARLRRIQVRALAAAEVRHSLLNTRALAVVLLIAMPLALMVLRAIFMPDSLRASPTRATSEFAEVFHFFLLRFIVFFANALIFVRLFRGEILEQSLHHTLLAPMRRDVLVAGKFLGGLVTALLVLLPTTVLTFLLVYLPHGRAGRAIMLSGAGLADLAGYLLIVVLACLAYGSLFLLAGLYFKNPMVPAVLFLGWEMLTPFLPPLLKSLSFVHYLASFAPVPVTVRAFTLLAQPVAWPLALVALVAASALLVFLATRVARRLEISYAAE